ncbi:winged helix-turn-helix domain-containing protein [Streptomyces sp. NPDC088788]|uniref:winged helix-turn-helix domain-containing protein n=1 Tax=Streptomyces sp. NPDC088788 TaxID=3365898 RepID=UPI0037FCA147
MRTDHVVACHVLHHVQDLLAQRRDLPVAVIARRAGVAVSTLKSFLSDAQRRPGTPRALNRAAALRLLAVALGDLPLPERGFGGRSTDATAAVRHVLQLLAEHPHLSQAGLARAAGMSPTTLAAALHDVKAGRPRRIQQAASEQLLSLGSRIPLPRSATRRSDTTEVQPVIDHIRELQLRYDRASLTFIARSAQVKPSTLTSALVDHERNPRRGISTDVAEKILELGDLPPPAFPRRSHVTEIGLLRRLRGMCAVGWPLSAIATTGATTAKSLSEFARTRTSTPAVRGAILTAWTQLSHLPGPSRQARRHAAAKAWHPALAWDEHSIDQPDSTPTGTLAPGMQQRWNSRLLQYELDFFTRLGLSHPECFQRLGLSTHRARELLTGTNPSQNLHATA